MAVFSRLVNETVNESLDFLVIADEMVIVQDDQKMLLDMFIRIIDDDRDKLIDIWVKGLTAARAALDVSPNTGKRWLIAAIKYVKKRSGVWSSSSTAYQHTGRSTW